MERLTERFENGQAAVLGCGNNCKYDYKYCNNYLETCPTITKIYEKLAAYEDAEEQDRIIKLPCKVGDDVWFVPSQTCYKLNILNGHGEANKVYHQKVARITFDENGWYMVCDKDLEYAIVNTLIGKMFNETWFLTQSEAEEKLKELRGNQNGKV